MGTAVLSCVRDGAATELGRGPVEMLPYRETLYGMDIARTPAPRSPAPTKALSPFTGRLDWVEYELEDDRNDLIEAAEVEHQNQLADQ